MSGDDEEAGDDMEMDMDMDMGDDMEEESIEYDFEESIEEEDEVVEEATKLSDKVADPKGGEHDSSNSTSPVAKHKDGWETGAPVKAKDGGDGDSGDNSPKDHTPTSNINVEPKKA
jgi:hypothetical protein